MLIFNCNKHIVEVNDISHHTKRKPLLVDTLIDSLTIVPPHLNQTHRAKQINKSMSYTVSKRIRKSTRLKEHQEFHSETTAAPLESESFDSDLYKADDRLLEENGSHLLRVGGERVSNETSEGQLGSERWRHLISNDDDHRERIPPSL